MSYIVNEFDAIECSIGKIYENDGKITNGNKTQLRKSPGHDYWCGGAR
jgi:hypothetical protein